MSDREYVLGTGDDELARLALQHRLWSDAALAAWKRAGIAPGQRVLDVGCGPGYACFDLAPLVTSTGAVLGIDESANFVAHAREQAKARGLPQVAAVQGDVQDFAGPQVGEQPFDLAYARWVLCFVREPAAVVRNVAHRLRPGGHFVVHDYFNYGSMTLAPRRRSHDLAVAATMSAWRDNGGDPDVVGRLPGMLAEHGLRLVHLDVHQRIARGSDSMFAWPDTWWRTFAPKLVAMGRLAQTDCDELLADLTAVRHSDTAFVQCPPVYELIAQKA
ncbi:MAG TPA: methyltransferase domain-containing protein [Planctomycetota bacterium]|nr:methyltransferase domain-containing protein [Planctomycetota bacterium]